MTLRIVTIRSIIYFALMTVITGIIYPLAVTAIAKIAFPYQANGSIIRIEGRKYGAENLGQLYRSPTHLWGRQMNIDTSFTGTDGKPAAYAWPSNLSPAGEKLEGLIAERVKEIHAANPAMGDRPVPVELVTSSGGGLDPHISPAAALYQVPRIAAATGLTEERVTEIIKKHTEGRFLGIMGEPRVHVLKVNLDLDGILKN